MQTHLSMYLQCTEIIFIAISLSFRGKVKTSKVYFYRLMKWCKSGLW